MLRKFTKCGVARMKQLKAQNNDPMAMYLGLLLFPPI